MNPFLILAAYRMVVLPVDEGSLTTKGVTMNLRSTMSRSGILPGVVITLIQVVFLAGCAGTESRTPPRNEGGTPIVTPSSFKVGQPDSTLAPTSPTGAGYPSPGAAVSPTAFPQPASMATSVTRFPDPSQFEWKKLMDGIDRPTDLTDPGNGALWVLSQGGRILRVKNGMTGVLMDISEWVGSAGNEQGLLGIALDPQFAENRYFYVNYTDTAGNTVIARFTAAADLESADTESEEKLIQVEQPYANHNGGAMAFGPDGFLYIGLGDGGSAGDPHNNAQAMDTLLGKILRIDVSKDQGYTVPPSNPFTDGSGQPEIFALGLRNPWRFSFDQASGDLYIADVGQDHYEEVDFLPSGSKPGVNFGWRLREGKHVYRDAPSAGLTLVDPIWEYDHSQGCSITGGYAYRGHALLEFSGVYLAGDFCSGKIWGLLRDENGNWMAQLLWDKQGSLTSFGQDRSGELYFLNRADGGLYRLERK